MRDYCHWQVPVLGTKRSWAEEAPCSLLKSAGQGAFLPPEASKHFTGTGYPWKRKRWWGIGWRTGDGMSRWLCGESEKAVKSPGPSCCVEAVRGEGYILLTCKVLFLEASGVTYWRPGLLVARTQNVLLKICAITPRMGKYWYFVIYAPPYKIHYRHHQIYLCKLSQLHFSLSSERATIMKFMVIFPVQISIPYEFINKGRVLFYVLWIFFYKW